MEKTGCKIICDAPTTLAVKGLMMMMIMMMMMMKHDHTVRCRWHGMASDLLKYDLTQFVAGVGSLVTD